MFATLIPAPLETSDDLAERYRQTRGFDEAEVKLVDFLCGDGAALDKPHAHTLRLALNLARLWVLDCDDGRSLIIGPKLGELREKIRSFAQDIETATRLDTHKLGSDAEKLKPLIASGLAQVRADFSGQIPQSELDREIRHKTLALVLGGGGGCGYVHLGALSLLEQLGISPGLIVGSSLGSIMGIFRSRFAKYRASMVERVTSELTFKNLFRILEGESRYGLPGTMRLYLRSAMAKYFMSEENRVLGLSELEIPFICVVTGVRRDAIQTDLLRYEHEFAKRFRRGPLAALLHVKDLVKSWATVVKDLVMSGGIKPIALGSCNHSKDFDALDAVGFSCSVPALIHYDILRDDPRMHQLTHQLLRAHEVEHLIDGGISSNVPARLAWEAIQRGHIQTRNTFILGLDCFAPQLGRNMIFMPLMRIAAENVAKDRKFAHHVFTYRKVLSPASLLPNKRGLRRAIDNGERELRAEQNFIKTMLEPLSAA